MMIGSLPAISITCDEARFRERIDAKRIRIEPRRAPVASALLAGLLGPPEGKTPGPGLYANRQARRAAATLRRQGLKRLKRAAELAATLDPWKS